MRPKVFIASSIEAVEYAKAIQQLLDHQCETTIWSQGVFGLSQGTLENLELVINKFDFAILILTPDDMVISRGEIKQSPRDNLLFELGLFVGRLGRSRTYIIQDRTNQIKLPSDFAGITTATFQKHSDGNLKAALGSCSTEIWDEIQKQGVRVIEEENIKYRSLKRQKSEESQDINSKKIIENASDNTEIRFISVTGYNDLSPNDSGLEHFKSALRRGIAFKGIIFNPEGIEAKFRSVIESPEKNIRNTLLFRDSKNVLDVLKYKFWKDKEIKMKYAKVGLQFKLWLSDKEAFIQPYHFGKDEDDDPIGMCKFTHILYSSNTDEYNLLKNHFDELWEKSDSFWPEPLFSRVEIEVNTNCNRKEYCSFCPNSKIGTIEPQIMEEKLYEKIIDELKDLKFKGRISFHFYGEPLIHPKIGKVIRYASQNLPSSERVIYTNGDKLDDEKYKELVDAGISKIIVTNLYSKQIKSRDNQIILNKILLNNKGCVLDESKALDLETPCYAPTHRLVIAYDGKVLLCYEDAERINVIGDVSKEKIINVWQSEKFKKARKELSVGNRKVHKPCKYCDNTSHIKFGQVYVNEFQ